jgi:SNF2 family DNA or RNA helicase
MIELVNRAQGHSFKKITGYQNLDELTKKLKEFSFMISKDECLDLPPKVYEQYAVDLTDEQKRIYKDLKNEAVATLSETSIVTVDLVMTKLLRLHQLVCGHLVDDDGKTHEIETNRLEVLDEVLEEAEGKQTVIWATYRHTLAKVMQHLSEKYGESSARSYFGDTSHDERRTAIDDFQSGKCQFFVGNPQTAGHGLTLTAASLHIYYSNNYSLEMRAQSEDRSHRIGQTKTVTYIDLYCPGTVDEKIMKALKAKRRMSDMIMSWREIF